MSSVAPTRLSRIVPLETLRSLNCTLARRLPGVLWSALVTTNSLPSIITASPRRISLARIDLKPRLLAFLYSWRTECCPVPVKGQGVYSVRRTASNSGGREAIADARDVSLVFDHGLGGGGDP